MNNDGFIDILDILKVIDHILTRQLLTPEEFYRANIAPWPAGQPFPTPDGVVNVQDLAVIQSIILTGQYPDGTPVPMSPLAPPNVNNHRGLAKNGSTADVKLTFYITNQGIAVGMNSLLRVKGLQFEFGNVPFVPSNMQVTTLLGDGPYYGANNLLRVLMYNQEARMVEPGSYLVANMPFPIANPQDVTLTHFVVAGEENNRITNVEIEITNGNAPELPVDYMLFQNYPNPFNPSTSVKFSVPQLGDVKVAVYNLLGQEVRTLFNGQMDRGTKVVDWDGRDNNGKLSSSGMYIYRMIAGDYVQSLKMMYLK